MDASSTAQRSHPREDVRIGRSAPSRPAQEGLFCAFPQEGPRPLTDPRALVCARSLGEQRSRLLAHATQELLAAEAKRSCSSPSMILPVPGGPRKRTAFVDHRPRLSRKRTYHLDPRRNADATVILLSISTVRLSHARRGRQDESADGFRIESQQATDAHVRQQAGLGPLVNPGATDLEVPSDIVRIPRAPRSPPAPES
jgi:hypothetical protein